MERILLVDFMGCAYYHFHAKEPHVEYNFIKNLREMMATFKFNKVFILTEGGGSAYRLGLHPLYKSTRKAIREKKSDADKKEYQKFLEKTNRLLEYLRMLGVEVLSVPKTEADDLAGYLCSHFPSSEYQICLLTEDTDWSQLLTRPNTVIGSYKEMVKEGIAAKKWRNFARFEEVGKGLDPNKFFVKKMLIGDKSDDIPGVTGIGEAFANAIVAEYPTLPEIVANRDSEFIQNIPRLPAKAKEALRGCEETFKLGFLLMNLKWPEEKWAEILGAEHLANLRVYLATCMDSKKVVDTKGFLEVCYTNGWLLFVDDEEFFVPFTI